MTILDEVVDQLDAARIKLDELMSAGDSVAANADEILSLITEMKEQVELLEAHFEEKDPDDARREYREREQAWMEAEMDRQQGWEV